MSEFKDIPGYEDYMINSLGVIISKERIVNYGRQTAKRKERILKQYTDGAGYLKVRLKNKNLTVHRLVVSAHYGLIDGFVVNHKDGNKKNNKLENLEQVTASENCSHAHRLGLKDQKGEKNPKSKLSNWQIPIIKNCYFLTKSFTKAAKLFNNSSEVKITRSTVHHIVSGTTWSHVN